MGGGSKGGGHGDVGMKGGALGSKIKTLLPLSPCVGWSVVPGSVSLSTVNNEWEPTEVVVVVVLVVIVSSAT